MYILYMQDLIVCGRVQKSPHSLEDSLEGTIDRLADIASKCEAAIKDPTTLFFLLQPSDNGNRCYSLP